ncbi:DUF4838 domain-containing protein [Lignipirellula cremea]|uniref:Glycosyl hydrolases family 2, sugar binding domain n=1 Tax=Lignipirellula cremea TaxID=2528010 RepID=A0A518DR61_9BACT|nr:DUF4838 domain-containing protein [Lignipirellula cremea]QDU94323.1 hypothetical protein Pla8534_21120 [Lignipirellula cremea]
MLVRFQTAIRFFALIGALLLSLIPSSPAWAATAGEAGKDELVIAQGRRAAATVVVAAEAGPNEKQAADDLVKYVEMMSGVKLPLASTPETIAQALQSKGPLLIIGQAALQAQPQLKAKLAGVLKKDPHLRADGIVLQRQGNRVYLAGANDLSHYFAVAELLRQWGCRWYLPTEFGECIPDESRLAIGQLDYAYGSPFEIRAYWISWNGDNTGAADFQKRNMLSGRGDMPSTGHGLGKYTKGLGKGTFDFPITDPKSAQHVAAQVDPLFAAGKDFSLGMEDGSYDSAYPKDQELMKLQWDKYFLRWSVTDPMLELYNNVARILQKKYPNSPSKIGFLAYANMTIPPVRDMRAERSLYCELAPIDIDPIHGMDDPQSPPRQEYRDMLAKWAKVMEGRLCIYDYDQGMLVWRDLPNPSHRGFQQDVQHYLKADILGVNTESRNAIATTFLNLHCRARLLWEPQLDLDGLLEEFYPTFYGPAAEPMQVYWETIYDAWENTIATEHEYFIAQAVYTPAVLAVLKRELANAEKTLNPLRVAGRKLSRNEQRYLDRMTFTRLSYQMIDSYMTMVKAAATDGDYKAAVAAGERALKTRQALTDMNGVFTSTKLEGGGYAWWNGEVKQYRELAPFVSGEKGKLLARLPLEWAARRDPNRVGVKQGLPQATADLTWWKEHQAEYDLDGLKDYPVDQWEVLRSDLYAQAQGVRHPDRQSFVGDLWYTTTIDLKPEQTADARLRFPGLFNECWLYVNGEEVAMRKQGKMWWLNDYRFEWDVDLAGKLKPGENTITLRCNIEHHFGGMFRRPFLYQAVE